MIPASPPDAWTPSWVGARLAGSAVTAASPLAWGFRNETWKIDLENGRSLAVTRIADRTRAARVVSLTAAVQPRMVAAGIPVPSVVGLHGPGTDGLLVTEFVQGVPGASALGTEGGPTLVGSLLGTAWRQFRELDPGGLALPAVWSDPGRLSDASAVWLDQVGDRLEPSACRRLASEIGTLQGLLQGRPPAFVHGDFVPVNIVVRERTLAALLDFEDARLGDPLLDAGWFAWVVGFHHPGIVREAWDAFAAAAGLDTPDPETAALLRLLPLVRLLEILVERPLPAEAERRWMRMLRAWAEGNR